MKLNYRARKLRENRRQSKPRLYREKRQWLRSANYFRFINIKDTNHSEKQKPSFDPPTIKFSNSVAEMIFDIFPFVRWLEIPDVFDNRLSDECKRKNN